MPVWLAPVVAGGLGFLGGYVLDQLFGDGDYTPREMFISTGTSMIGGGLLRPVGQTLGRTVKYGKNLADDIYRAGAVTYDEIIAAGYIMAPMVSKPARIEVAGGIVAGYVYDYATRQSPDVRSERNASDVTSGGTPSGYKKPRRQFGKRNGKVVETRIYCSPGFELVKYKGKFYCRRKGSGGPGKLASSK